MYDGKVVQTLSCGKKLCQRVPEAFFEGAAFLNYYLRLFENVLCILRAARSDGPTD